MEGKKEREGWGAERKTYTPPKLNISITPNRFRSDMWSPKSMGMSMAMTKTPITRFVMPEMRYAMFCPSQVPAIVLSQLYWTGLQSTKVSTKTEMKYAKVTTMVP